jgi:hypothetical protein
MPGDGVSSTDANTAKEQSRSTGAAESAGSDEASTVTTVSDTAAAESPTGGSEIVGDDGGGSKGISSFGRGSVHQGGAADRILGLALPPRDERGPGVEVIRGMRQTFQPTDASGRAEGTEIPFGRGTLQRLENLGATFDEAIEFAVKIDEANSAAVQAGAQALIARTNAMTLTTADLNGDGNKTQVFIGIEQNGDIFLADTGLSEPIGDRLMTLSQPVEIKLSTGLSTTGRTDVLVEIITADDGSLVYVPLGRLNTAADKILVQENHAEYLIHFARFEAEGNPDPHAAAVAFLREADARSEL